MAAADLISWGIGSPASIRAFILDGLSTNAGAPSDTTPNALSFTDQGGVALSVTITSSTETLTGTDADSPISIAGDASSEYQFNGGAWTSSPGNIPAGSTYAVRHTSSASYLTATNTVLTIGGVSDTFTSITLADPAASPRMRLRRLLRNVRKALYS